MEVVHDCWMLWDNLFFINFWWNGTKQIQMVSLTRIFFSEIHYDSPGQNCLLLNIRLLLMSRNNKLFCLVIIGDWWYTVCEMHTSLDDISLSFSISLSMPVWMSVISLFSYFILSLHLCPYLSSPSLIFTDRICRLYSSPLCMAPSLSHLLNLFSIGQR